MIMSAAEIGFLVVVLGATVIFAATLAFYSRG
jgi:hypothetical protein